MVAQKDIKHASGIWGAYPGAQPSQIRTEVLPSAWGQPSPPAEGTGQGLMSAKLTGEGSLNDGVTCHPALSAHPAP